MVQAAAGGPPHKAAEMSSARAQKSPSLHDCWHSCNVDPGRKEAEPGCSLQPGTAMPFGFHPPLRGRAGGQRLVGQLGPRASPEKATALPLALCCAPPWPGSRAVHWGGQILPFTHPKSASDGLPQLGLPGQVSSCVPWSLSAGASHLGHSIALLLASVCSLGVHPNFSSSLSSSLLLAQVCIAVAGENHRVGRS